MQRLAIARIEARLRHVLLKTRLRRFIAPRALATSGRRPGVRAKRAARGVAGRQLLTGARNGSPIAAIIK